MSLTVLYTWRNVCVAYFPLESFLSTIDMADEAIICVDVDSDDETVELAQAIAKKYPQAQVLGYQWKFPSGMGSAIGDASNYALSHAKTDYVVNVQADEVWHPELTQWVRENLADIDANYNLFSFRFLHTRYNAQELQANAGYQDAIKAARRLSFLKFAPDAWQFEFGPEFEKLASVYTVTKSIQYPIVHLHHFFQGGILHQLAENTVLFGDTNSYEEYGRTMADKAFMRSPIWDTTMSPFKLPELVLSHLGEFSYKIHWELLK